MLGFSSLDSGTVGNDLNESNVRSSAADERSEGKLSGRSGFASTEFASIGFDSTVGSATPLLATSNSITRTEFGVLFKVELAESSAGAEGAGVTGAGFTGAEVLGAAMFESGAVVVVGRDLTGCRIKRLGDCAPVVPQKLVANATAIKAVTIRFARSMLFPMRLALHSHVHVLRYETAQDDIVANNPTTKESESVRRIEPIATIDLGIRSLTRQDFEVPDLQPLQPLLLDEEIAINRIQG